MVSEVQIKTISYFMLGAAFVLVMLSALTFIFSVAQLPVSGIRNAFLILTALFSVAGTALGLVAGITSGKRRLSALS